MSWLMAIDVGTSSTAAAVVDPGGEPTLLSFDGAPVMPSGVLLTDRGALLVGAEAERYVGASPDHYERSPKRRLGDRVMLLGGRPVEPVAAIAAVLAGVLEVAVAQQGGAPDALRMTVPARWGGVRAGLLAEAAVRAGLPEPVLVPEPVAAALFAAEPGLATGAHVAVYDLGGGTLDTAVLRRTDTGFEVVGSPGGNDQLGGELFDDLVLDHLGARIGEVAPDAWEQVRYSTERPWQRLGHELRVEARRAKEALSSATEYDLYLGAPLDMEGRVTRDELEVLLRPMLKESVGELLATVRRAGITPTELARVYVVGGATRTPLVLRLIAEEFGTMPVTWGDPKAAVVLGAASPAALSVLHRPRAPGYPRSPADAATTADLATAITGEVVLLPDGLETQPDAPTDRAVSANPCAPTSPPGRTNPGDAERSDPALEAPAVPAAEEPEPAVAEPAVAEPAVAEPAVAEVDAGVPDADVPDAGVGQIPAVALASISVEPVDQRAPDAVGAAPARPGAEGALDDTTETPRGDAEPARSSFNPAAMAITLACATAAVVLIVILVIAAVS